MADNGGQRTQRQLNRIGLAGEEFGANGFLSEKTRREAEKPPFSREVYKTILENVWQKEREKGGKA